jgi:hypothetical protein
LLVDCSAGPAAPVVAAAAQVEMSGRSHKGPFTWQLRKEDLQDRLNTDMAAACGSIAKAAVLSVHGSADADVPVQDAHKIAAAIKVSSCSYMDYLTGDGAT